MRKRRRERRMKIAEREEEGSEWREKEFVEKGGEEKGGEEKENNCGRTGIE
jgi:hypothetical protein